MKRLRLLGEEVVPADERRDHAAAEDQRGALEAHRERVDGRIPRRYDQAQRVVVCSRLGDVDPQQGVDGARDREAQAANRLAAEEAHPLVRRVVSHLLSVRHEERVAVLKIGFLRIEEITQRPRAKVLVVRQMPKAQVEVIAEQRGHGTREEHIIRLHACRKNRGAMLDIVQQRKLPQRQRATNQHC